MGYDSHEDITFEVAKHSIETRSSVPVDIFPLKRKDLQVSCFDEKEEKCFVSHLYQPKQGLKFEYFEYISRSIVAFTGGHKILSRLQSSRTVDSLCHI